ncbi:facilitated trehalose transporter Tret1-2 homolog isoform X2 [Artemia franciscana]|uniref:Major facilitator superfamily (MFS) profile domain-containing protein n=2 Tax=Artemia franciscana TaxID=6661 RepID=A0AA88HMJ6_ARTSF|nr:hypothetical protein QYM36_011659 [Artemia franciscana]KAK2713030.1 hypothetical protein QYM36_011659 [Artemia franciscana]KAK2713031.1 hypothetical protein QYM36_011659 [Artemia franciscana]
MEELGEPEELSSEFLSTPKAKSLKHLKNQILAIFSADLCSFCIGAGLGWAAPSLPQLGESELGLSTADVSVIGSALNIGGAIGALSGGLLIDYVGRKKTFLFITPLFLFGFLCVALGVNFYMLVMGRILIGLASGLTTISAPVFAGEIADPKYRGLLATMFSFMLVCGILTMYILGAFFQWRTVTFACLLFPISGFIATIIFVPESPVYLARQNDLKKAKKNYFFLRGHLFGFEDIAKDQDSNIPSRIKLRYFFNKRVFKPVSICLALMFFQQACGVNGIFYNLKIIFDISGGNIPSSLQVIIVGLVQLSTTIISSIIIDHIGRKTLLIISGIAMGASTTCLGVYFHYSIHSPERIHNLYWLPLASLIVFSAFFYVGFGPVTWTVLGEILPLEVKGATSAIVTSFGWFLAFLVTMTYGIIVETFNQSIIFLIYGSFSFLGALYVLICIPETTGKTLSEIQKLFS